MTRDQRPHRPMHDDRGEEIPERIRRLFARPGSQWSRADRALVAAWLFGSQPVGEKLDESTED